MAHFDRYIFARSVGRFGPTSLSMLNPDAAHVSAALCQLVYDALDEKLGDPAAGGVNLSESEARKFIEGVLAELGYQEQLWFFFAFGPVAVLGVRVDDVWFVAIAGTRTFDDWMVNLRASQLPFGSSGARLLLGDDETQPSAPCSLQSGYFYLGNLVSLGVRSEILKRMQPNDRVALTGHSLGGAVAMSVSACMSRTKATPASLLQLSCIYTFGMPMFGAGNLSDFISCDHYRIARPLDLVQDTPPLASYHHDTVGYALHDSGELSRSTYVGKSIALSSDAVPVKEKQAVRKGALVGTLIKAHHMIDYLRLVAKMKIDPTCPMTPETYRR